MDLSVLERECKRPYHWLKGLGANLVYGFPSKRLTVLAVTGTDGKTTTSTILYEILKTAGKKVALISTVAAFIGDQEIDTGFHVTTPEEFALQRLLKRIADDGYEYVVLEATSHGIYQHRFFGINPSITVLTNITHEHLDYHKTIEAYAAVKCSLLKRSKISILNAQDNTYALVKKLLSGSSIKQIEYSNTIDNDELDRAIKNRFPEQYNQQNAVAAATAARVFGIEDDAIVRAVNAFQGVRGRMEEIQNDQGIRAIVDFAHTPNALEKVLTALHAAKQKNTKLIVVFGSAGLRDASKRPLMGKAASELADEAVITAEDPRSEDVRVIIHQIKDGATKNWGHLHEVDDRREAIRFAICTLAQKGDTVVVCGKGHERSLNLDGKKEIPWSDQEEVRQALELKKHNFAIGNDSHKTSLQKVTAHA